MNSSDDVDLQKTEVESRPPVRHQGPPLGLWIALALLIGGAAVAIYIVFGRQPATPTTTSSRPVATTTTPPGPVRSLGQPGEQIALPPLEETDPLVRRLVRTLSANPTIATWLATDGLIRNFVVVVANIADGATPARHLKPLHPRTDFRSVVRGADEVIDPQSYNRYDVFTDALTSIDPAGAARLYGTLKPRIEDAAAELGYPDHEFDRVLERAIVALVKTPVVNDPIRVTPKGIGYAYADDRLENLTGAQKQLLRMGPANVQRIEARLREIAVALGINPLTVTP